MRFSLIALVRKVPGSMIVICFEGQASYHEVNV